MKLFSNMRRRPDDAPVFLATEKFDPTDGQRWIDYVKRAKIPALTEIVGLDTLLCPRLVRELIDEDWNHIVQADFRLDYFEDLPYLLKRVADLKRRNILGLYRNPPTQITKAPAKHFAFIGHDLIEEATQISALTNCGGFPESFSNNELNQFGLISAFERAREIQEALTEKNPKEAHARCELYSVWRLQE